MLALALLPGPQGDADALARVEADQADRVAVVERAIPAVCAVMPVHGEGGGSGVIIDPLGFVLTNFHVIGRGKRPEGQEPPPELPELPLDVVEPRFQTPPPDTDDDDPAWKVMKVGLPDGELYLADVLGIDPGSDLAVLLLRPHPDGRPYPSAELGDSDQLLVGEPVFAAGNPFLLANDFVPTVTWGIVSGTHRYQAGGANRFLVYPDCIQVDAPVNPGNSGGPLFNGDGEVVGINGRISVRDRGRVNIGVGFAIASNQVRNFLGDLMAGRHAEHGTLDLNAWFMNSRDDERRRCLRPGDLCRCAGRRSGCQSRRRADALQRHRDPQRQSARDPGRCAAHGLVGESGVSAGARRRVARCRARDPVPVGPPRHRLVGATKTAWRPKRTAGWRGSR